MVYFMSLLSTLFTHVFVCRNSKHVVVLVLVYYSVFNFVHPCFLIVQVIRNVFLALWLKFVTLNVKVKLA